MCKRSIQGNNKFKRFISRHIFDEEGGLAGKRFGNDNIFKTCLKQLISFRARRLAHADKLKLVVILDDLIKKGNSKKYLPITRLY